MKTLKRVLFLVMLLAAFVCLFAVTAGAETTTEVGTVAALKTAVSADGTGDVIKLTADMTLTEQLVIARSVTIDGDGQYKITGGIGSSSACMIVAGNADVTDTLSIAFRGISLESTTGYVLTTAGTTNLTLASGTTVTLSNQSKTGSIYLLYNTQGCTTTIQSGASVQLIVNLTANNIDKAKVAISNKGIMHVYGSVMVGNLASGAMYMQGINNAETTGVLYIYDGAYIANSAPVTVDKSCTVWCRGDLFMTGGTLTGAANASTLVVGASTSEVQITGGKISNTWEEIELSDAVSEYIANDADEYLYAAICSGNGSGKSPSIVVGGTAVVEAIGDGVAIHASVNSPTLTIKENSVVRAVNGIAIALLTGAKPTISIEDHAKIEATHKDGIAIHTGRGGGTITMKGAGAQISAVGTAIAMGDAEQTNSDGRTTLKLNGGTITADVCILITTKFTMELNGATLEFGTYGIHVYNTTTYGQTHNVTINSGVIRQIEGKSGMALYMHAGKIDLTVNGGTITAGKQALRVAGNTKITMAFRMTGGTLTSAGAVGLDLIGDANDSFTITGGSVCGNGSADAGVQILGFADGTGVPVLQVYGGYFESAYMCALRVYEGATVSIYGGTFRFAPTSSSRFLRNVIRAGTGSTVGTANIYGGHFIHEASVGGTAEVGAVFNGVSEGSAVNLYAYTCEGGDAILQEQNVVTLAYPYGSYSYACNLPEMQSGASLRLMEGNNGLRFTSFYSYETVAALQAIADNGTISYGTLIVPYASLTGLTHFSLDTLNGAGVAYLNILAKNGIVENGTGYLIRAAIVNIKEKNKDVPFAAIGYVTYTVNGETVYNYTIFHADEHSRSIKEVARMATEDVSPTKNAAYRYALADGTYSRFSESAREVLAEFYQPERVIDIYLIAGQSNGAGMTVFNEEFFNSNENFKNGYENILYYGTAGSVPSPYDILYTNRVTVPETVKSGFGKNGSYFGPELGMAEALSAYYNSETGRTAGIIKYAVGGTSLTDILTGQNSPAGNWCSPSYLAKYGSKGELSGGLYRNFLAEVTAGIEAYRALGYQVNLKAIYWMQGEGDSQRDVLEAYAEMLELLIGDMRRDLGTITGGRCEDLPVVIGEISDSYKISHKACFTEFIAMQNRVAAKLEHVWVNHSGVFGVGTDGSDSSHWTCDDGFYIGQMLGCLLADIVLDADITTPTLGTPVAKVYSADGALLGSYASLAHAINSAPAGARVVLLDDLTLYGNLNINNRNAITVDGNGHRIDSYSVTHGVRLVGCHVTFVNFDFYHHTDAKGAYAVYCYEGATVIFKSGTFSSYQFGIVVNESATVTIDGGTYITRYSEAETGASLYVSKSGNADVNASTVTVNGGTFVSIGVGAAIAVNNLAGNRSVVRINACTTVTDPEAPAAIYFKAGSGSALLTAVK